MRRGTSSAGMWTCCKRGARIEPAEFRDMNAVERGGEEGGYKTRERPDRQSGGVELLKKYTNENTTAPSQDYLFISITRG